MARMNVYLPDELVAQVKEAGLNLSAVRQEAVRQRLVTRSTDGRLSTLPYASAAPVSHETALQAVDAERDEAPTRHG